MAGQKRTAETIALVITPPISTVGRFSAGNVHEQHAQDRAQHGNSAEHKRVNHSRRVVRQRQCADKDRADQAHRVRFEHIGGHARAIAHVVADVVCDRRRVARIVFFETLLDLAHKVRADIGGLGVNAAAESREHADETSPERETDQTIDRHVRPGNTRDQSVENRYRQKRESHHEQPGNGAAVESHSQGFVNRLCCGLRRPHVGHHGDAHPNETGRKRAKRADNKANGRRTIFENEKQNENDYCDRADRDHLPIQIRLGAFLNGSGDLSASVDCLRATELPRRLKRTRPQDRSPRRPSTVARRR